MSPWEVLGVSADADESLIRRAYAEKLKMRRPEDDIDAFQQLRAAYEFALGTVRERRRNTNPNSLRDGSVADITVSIHSTVFDKALTAESFIDQANTMIERGCKEESEWNFLIEQIDDLPLSDRDRLRLLLVPALPKMNIPVPGVYKRLNAFFQWEKDRDAIQRLFTDGQLNTISNIVQRANFFRHFKTMPENASKYYELYCDAYTCMKRGELQQAEGLLSDLLKREPNLADAYVLYIFVLKTAGRWEQVHRLISVARISLPADTTQMLLGEAFFNIRSFEKANEAYSQIRPDDSCYYDALRFSALSKERSGNEKESIQLLREFVNKKPDDIYSLCVLRKFLKPVKNLKRKLELRELLFEFLAVVINTLGPISWLIAGVGIMLALAGISYLIEVILFALCPELI